MNSPEFARFPKFEDLPEQAQLRIGSISQKYGLPHQQAMAVMLMLSKGATAQQVAVICRKSDVALKHGEIKEIAREMNGWVSLGARRRRALRTLEEKGLLTPERREALLAATTPAAVAAVYFEAIPLEPYVGQEQAASGDGAWWSMLDGIDPWTLCDFFEVPGLISDAWEKVWKAAGGAVEGAGDWLSAGWDQIDFSSFWDGIDL
ncbi:MAG TPA: hypothetical protein VNQ90_20945 [Chthoniobacteraceae bacterium]|nr:hypothetical protein [Chthoniobacteraceae bacterium]